MKEKLEQEQKQAEGTYKPELCKKSLILLENKKKRTSTSTSQEDLHSRLYLSNQQKQMQEIAELEELGQVSNKSSLFVGHLSDVSEKSMSKDVKEATFVPKISKKSRQLKRDGKIDSILYNDALRRQHKSIEFNKKAKQTTNTSKMSEGSRKALASRFIREYDLTILEFLAPEKSKLDYLQVNAFLRRLCFLRDSEAVELPHFTPERILLHEMWISLCGEQNGGIHRRNLLVFLLAVMGLYFQITKIQKNEEGGDRQSVEFKMNTSESMRDGPNKTSSHLGATSEEPFSKVLEHTDNSIEVHSKMQLDIKPIGSFDSDGNYEITPEEVNKIQSRYLIWRVNRMGSPDNIGQLVTSRNYEEPSYRPEINEHSRNIAHLYREKILETTTELIQANKLPAPKDGKITHADLLVLAKKVAKEKLEQTKMALENEEMEGCTFKPVTNDVTQTSRILGKSTTRSHIEGDSRMDVSLGGDRCQELYSLRKQKVEKKDKSRFDIEYEKNCDECTFQPDLNATRLKNSSICGPVHIPAKNIEKTIERMRNAQAMREQKILESQRGYNPTLEDPSFVFTVDKPKNKKAFPDYKGPGGQGILDKSQRRTQGQGMVSESQRLSNRHAYQIESKLINMLKKKTEIFVISIDSDRQQEQEEGQEGEEEMEQQEGKVFGGNGGFIVR